MSIRARVLTALGVMQAMLIAGILLNLVARVVDDRMELVFQRDQRAAAISAEIRRALVVTYRDRRAFLMSGSAEVGADFANDLENYRRAVATLRPLLPTASQQARLKELEDTVDAWVASWDQIRPRPMTSPAEGDELARLVERRFQPVLDRLDAFERDENALRLARRQQVDRQRNRARNFMLALSVVASVALAALLLGFKRSMLDPLADLARAARRIAAGNVETIPPSKRSDEIGTLINTLAQMTTSLIERERQSFAAQAEAELARRELQAALETAPAAFLLVDATGQVRVQNRAATALIGPPPDEEIAMTAYRRTFRLTARDGRELPPDQWPLARALRGETVSGEDVDVIRDEGDAVPMLVAAAPLRNASGAIDGAAVAFQDVSRLREVDRLKNEFVSSVSHELRTPLTSIRGSLQLVLDDPEAVPDEDHRQLLNVGLNNCERLIRIINDILDISKIEAGRMTLHKRPSSLEQLIRQAIDTVTPIADNANVQLETRTADLPVLLVDPDRIVQALVNLLSNAVKFAPPDSAVLITVATGENVTIAVEDRGEGISEEDLARLFQKFQQVDGSASRRRGGTGLGLAITKALVEQHGGRVEVESARGVGSRFSIVLPATTMVAAMAGPVVPVAVAERRGDHSGVTVLIIDDDDEFRLVIRRYLEKYGFTVVEARDGAAGLHVAREVHPDLITLDLMMPGMNGWEALAHLTEDPDLSDIPIIVISAIADQPGTLVREVTLVSKPVSQRDLIREIEATLAPSTGTVLIAEDDDDLRTVLARALNRRGYQVMEARDGAEALALFDRQRPDLLVVDLRMPNVGGLAVIKRLRETAAAAAVSIIAVSGSDGDGALRALNLGADAYMPKPLDAQRLARMIEELLTTRR